MELRPRKGRSAQPPSTPTIAKPPQSSLRKKPASPPSTPIHIPSDDEDADPKEIYADLEAAAPKKIHTDKVAAAHLDNGDVSALKQGNQDIIPLDCSEFETPLSSIAKLCCAQNKVNSSNFKTKTKVTSSVMKKMAEELVSTPVANTRIANYGTTADSEKAGLDEATIKKVCGAPNGDIASEETEKQEVITSNVPPNSDELAVEIAILAQEECSKKPEVICPRSDTKKVHSSKMKSAKKRDEVNEVIDAQIDRGVDQEHIIDIDAPIVSKSQSLSLILSDDESVQVSDAIQVNAYEENISAGKKATLEKCLPGADISKVIGTSKKFQSNKDIVPEENLSRKLFEETSDVTIPCTDTEPDDQTRHELDSIENSSKEGAIKFDTVEVQKYEERIIITSERHGFKSPSASLEGREVTDFEMVDSEEDKVDASDAGIEGKDIVNDCVQEVSEKSSGEAVSSRDEDISNDHAKLYAATACSQKNAVHDKECSSSDDDTSTGSDDDDEDEMASVFFSSMKAHLRSISEASGLRVQKDEQAKQDAFVRLESQLTKSAVKEPCANGGLTGHRLLWSPETVLSSAKTSKERVGKPRSVVEASIDTIWGRDRGLQDGLCVPPVDPLKLNKLARKQKDDTTGAKWFNLSAPTITPELKKELQLLKLRGAIDPKRHYKAEDSKGLPKFFQVGTVVGGPADFYSGRLTKKEQKSSLASELLADSSLTSYRKRKYTEIQDQKQAGGKGFWKKKKSKRTPAWAKI